MLITALAIRQIYRACVAVRQWWRDITDPFDVGD
jgi:hypothetical protein